MIDVPEFIDRLPPIVRLGICLSVTAIAFRLGYCDFKTALMEISQNTPNLEKFAQFTTAGAIKSVIVILSGIGVANEFAKLLGHPNPTHDSRFDLQ